MLNERDFIKEFDKLRSWIRESVTDFSDDTPESKSERIRRASEDKFFFAKTYFPHYTEDEFAPVHKELFELSDVYNQPVVVAGTRELAKSTVISFFDEIHKTLFKKNKFTIFICDTQETAASEFLLPIRAELEENQRIISDFGEQLTQYRTMEDFITKSGKRFLALGPKMGSKGKKHRSSRPDRIVVEDFENQNSPRKKSILKRRLNYILKDVMKGVNFKKWQFIFVGNYFSKKTLIHILLTSPEHNHWIRKIYPAITEDSKGKQKSIWESRMPLKSLLAEQKEDPFTFRTERMQKPDDEEAIFKEEWIQKFEMSEIADFNFPVVTYHDPSALKGEEHCFKATIALAVDIQNLIYYVIHARIRKESKWKSADAHFDISEELNSAVDGIEANGFQSSLKEDYEILEKKRGKRLNLKMITNRVSKEIRINRLSSPIERGYIKFLRAPHHSDINLLIEQLIDYPDGDFVDGPDALSGAVEIADTHILKKLKKITSKIL